MSFNVKRLWPAIVGASIATILPAFFFYLSGEAIWWLAIVFPLAVVGGCLEVKK